MTDFFKQSSNLLNSLNNTSAGAETLFNNVEQTLTKHSPMSPYHNMRDVGVKDYARASYFLCEFALPPSLVQLYKPRVLELVSAQVSSVNIPSLSYASFDFKSKSTRKQIYNSVYNAMEINFHIDSNNITMEYLNAWLASMSEGNNKMRYLDEYATDFVILGLDRSGNIISTVQFFELFPITVGAVQYSSEAEGILTVSVTFQYTSHRIVDSPETSIISRAKSMVSNIVKLG